MSQSECCRQGWALSHFNPPKSPRDCQAREHPQATGEGFPLRATHPSWANTHPRRGALPPTGGPHPLQLPGSPNTLLC